MKWLACLHALAAAKWCKMLMCIDYDVNYETQLRFIIHVANRDRAV